MDYFVEHIQPHLPTKVVRNLLRFIFVLWDISGIEKSKAKYIEEQIECDTKLRGSRDVTMFTEETNEQHYGNDPQFFVKHLGPRLKYSCCNFNLSAKSSWLQYLSYKIGISGKAMESKKEEIKTLAEAETLTIREYQSKLGLDELPDNSLVLEAGCGWGSLLLENAATYKNLLFFGFSNSPQQIEYIRSTCKEKKLDNVKVFVKDYKDFCSSILSQAEYNNSNLFTAKGVGNEEIKSEHKVFSDYTNHNQQQSQSQRGKQQQYQDDLNDTIKDLSFDAIVCIETIEHAIDIKTLLYCLGSKLNKTGKMLIHSIIHDYKSYIHDATGEGNSNWMMRNFFSGGSILAKCSYANYLSPSNLEVISYQEINGRNYAKTLDAWLDQLEANKTFFIQKYGQKFYEGFRAFYIVSSVSFEYNNGNNFKCGYYVFQKQDGQQL